MAPGQGPLYGASMQATCAHLAQIRDVGPGRDVCESCIEIGGTWVHLRLCLICGRTGCCDSSPNRHASRHAHDEGHPIAKSLEPAEDCGSCSANGLEPIRPSVAIRHCRSSRAAASSRCLLPERLRLTPPDRPPILPATSRRTGNERDEYPPRVGREIRWLVETGATTAGNGPGSLRTERRPAPRRRGRQ